MSGETLREAWPLAAELVVGVLLLRAALPPFRARGASAWLALALAGQIAALQLYDAGPKVGYHHYRVELPAETWKWGKWLALQAVCVAVGIWSQRAAYGAMLARVLGGWRSAVFLVLALAAAAKLSRPAARSGVEFAFALGVQLVALGNLWLFVRALPAESLASLERRWERWFGPESTAECVPGGPDRYAWGLAALSALVAAALNVLVYERSPHVPDEAVYLLHARYLAAGELWLSPPPVPAAFDLDLMLLDGGKWYCPVPPGWPLVLAVGARLGVPWLVNPVLGGVTVLVVHALLRELTSKRAARIALLLMAVSPWFVFLNMSFMTHPLTLLAASTAALGVARSRRTGHALGCVVAGVAIGVVALVRPFDGALLALLLGSWSIGLGGARLRPLSIVALVLASALSGLATLPYNKALTGDALRFPIQRYVDVVYGPGKNDMGFGPDKGLEWGGLDPWPGHSLGEALVTAQFNLFSVGAELFGWCVGSLALVWMWLLCARWGRTDRAMACVVLAVVGGSLLYWFNGGPDFGARYWHLILVPLVWATLRGASELAACSQQPSGVRAGVAGLVALSLLTWFPWRALDKYWGYRGMSGAPRDVALAEGLGRELVLVQGARHPDFAALAWLNPIDWDGAAPVYAWARDARTVVELLRAFPDRRLRIGRTTWERSDSAESPLGRAFELSEPLDARAAWSALADAAPHDDWSAWAPRFEADGSLAREARAP